MTNADLENPYKEVGGVNVLPTLKTVDDNMTTVEIIKFEIVQLKWRALILMCFLTFGSYYIYDFPGSIGTGHQNSIESRFLDHGKPYTQEMNQALYSVYSWPNTVLAIFGGLLIDKYIGLRKSVLLFSCLVLTGSVIFYFGVVTTQYPLLIVGRIVYGLGGESLCVAQNAFVARWFKCGRGIALAFGIAMSVSRVGSSCNFLLSPIIAGDHGVTVATLTGTAGCVISLIMTSGLVALDVYATRKGTLSHESLENNAGVDIRGIFKFPKPFWLVSGICVGVYCSIFPLIAVAKNFFTVKYGISGATASTYVSIYQFVCAGGSPVIGLAVDNIGRFTYWMIASGIGFSLVHLLFIVASPPPFLMMGLMGGIYSFLVSSLWPCVPFVVDKDLVGLAYGIMTAMQNAGLATFPLISGAILDAYTPEKLPLCSTVYDHATFAPGKTAADLIGCTNSTAAPLPTEEGYHYTEILFLGAALVGVGLAIVLLIVDKTSNGGLLSASPARRAEIKAEHQSLLGADALGDFSESSI